MDPNKAAIFFLEKRDRKLERILRSTVSKILRATNQKSSYLEIYIVGNRFMHKNVLAFPAPENFPRPDLKKWQKWLGEIYLNPVYIKKEKLKIAPEQAISKLNQVLKSNTALSKIIYMLIHGFLHLLGYDHKRKRDRIKMEKKEIELCQII